MQSLWGRSTGSCRWSRRVPGNGNLWRLLAGAAAEHPQRPAVRESTGLSIRYDELLALADGVAHELAAAGVRAGDRVGVLLPKTIDSVAAFFAALKLGAAYVPVDPTAPIRRAAFIFSDCGVRVAIVAGAVAAELARELDALGAQPTLLAVAEPGGGDSLRRLFGPARATTGAAPVEEDSPAYLLYTSGSTGVPKGVVLTHGSARSFIDWCSSLLRPTPEDRFASHAPFHFDISVLDLFTSLRHGAELLLISEKLSKSPAELARFAAETEATVWYSVPSVLALMCQYGRLDELDLRHLRAVLFAGEVFPLPQLRDLMTRLPHPAYYNLYGPTETNVCTFYQVPGPIEETRTVSLPIGKPCAGYEARVVSPGGEPVDRGAEGELVVRGPGVMLGYWARPEATAAAFLPSDDGRPWYRTGDIVVEEVTGDYRYIGRRDRMIKKRGYRVELGEIEACLGAYDDIGEAAVIAVRSATDEVETVAVVSARAGTKLSIIAIKRFCSQRLPGYMVPDRFEFVDALPRTSTGKIDYQTLARRQG